MKNFKKLLALLIATTLLLSLSACGQQTQESSSGSKSADAVSQSSSAGSGTEAESTPAEEDEAAEPFGKPWLVSILEGNIPNEAPDAKDDLFLSLDYDLIAEHQGDNWTNATAYSDELKTKTLDAINQKDDSDHEAEQFKIFVEQAADMDALAKAGISEVQPYIDRIDKAGSIEELNEVLIDRDFPFCPFVIAVLGVTDKRENTDVMVYPNFLFFDLLSEGAQFYDGADTEEGGALLQQMLMYTNIYLTVDFLQLGLSEDEALEEIKKLTQFETAYGKYADYNGRYVKSDFGSFSKSLEESVFTLDELCDLCPNIPLRDMLAKMGKDGAEKYSAMSFEWLKTLGDMWTEENLDTLKTMSKAKIMAETRPYRDPQPYNSYIEQFGLPAQDAETFAWAACNSLDTFAQIISRTYADDVLGENAKTRLTKIAEDAVADYKKLFSDTSWLSEESGKKAVEKLDNLTINVLEPSAGWFDYSVLELTPSGKGGTLFSNYLKLKQYRYDREAELIGQPAIGCFTWYFVNPSIPNAFYNSQDNSINIVPGYINSLTYSDDMDDSMLLGGAGWTIGHELSHGFDYLGAQSDAYGLGNPIFTEEDIKAFLDKCENLADLYSTIELEPGEMYDGHHVVAEAAADLSGMQVMLDLMADLENPDYERFFAKGAELYAQTVSAMAYSQLKADGHPLHYMRVNVNAQMFDEFYKTYKVKNGDGMYLAEDKRIRIYGDGKETP